MENKNVNSFILSNDYHWTITRPHNKGKVSIEGIINEYINPVKEMIEVKLKLIQTVIEFKENELRESNYSSCLKLNIEISCLREQLNIIKEIYNEL